MKRKYKKGEEGGFILIFTLLFMIVMLGIVIVTTQSSIDVLKGVTSKAKSFKAFYAADTGVECISYYASLGVFDTWRDQKTYDCFAGISGADGTFTAGLASPTAAGACQATGYNYTLALPNGSCTDVSVETVSFATTTPDGTPVDLCKVRVYSRGHSTCNAASAFSVERLQSAAFEAPFIACFGQLATIINGDGTSGDDIIYASAGDDTVYGYGGDDVICGLTGDDTIYGGGGNDTIAGDEGVDSIDGDDGNDYLKVDEDSENDSVTGEVGYDTCVLGSGDSSATCENLP